MTHGKSLVIHEQVLDALFLAAKLAGRNECMGLLAADCQRRTPTIVSAACLLPATASAGHAEASPEAIYRAAELLRKRMLVPIGVWHSHGAHAVFHSATDDATVKRFLPSMMEWTAQSRRHAFAVPIVTDRDEAALPLVNGQWLKVFLAGPDIPGLNARERLSWSSIEVEFDGTTTDAHAECDGASVHLIAAGIRLTLGIPDGGRVSMVGEDPCGERTAVMYSLVVNRRGDAYAERFLVHECERNEVHFKEACAIEVVDPGAGNGCPGLRLLGV